MSTANSNGPFRLAECSICGKVHLVMPNTIYKVKFAGKTYHCCSHTCYRIAKKLKEDNNEASYKRVKDELKQ